MLVVLGVTMILRPRREPLIDGDDPGKDIMPQTPSEAILFVVFALVVGCSWEILYRGYLLWLFPARVGLPVSILIAAAAYGLAHGFRSSKMLVGSLISALIFTAAFAVTRSLWWLMLVHCGLPLIGAAAFNRRSAPVRPGMPPAAPDPDLSTL
jgi:membrane protease YdiL (CAAX protease family)